MKMRTLTAVGMISALLLTLTACGGPAASSPDAAPSSLSASGAADSSQAAKPYDLFKTAFDKTTAETSIQIAEKLKMTTVETARESERGIVDIETLTYTNQQLISTIDEVLNIQQEGRQKRQAAEQELGRIEGELKQKLLEVRR